MAWFKVDDKFYTHPKAFAAGLFGVSLWLRTGCWCSDHLTDGHVPLAMLPILYGWAQLPEGEGPGAVERLVQAGLWEEDTEGLGYVFHDWSDYQPSRDEVEYRRSRDRRKAELHSKRCDSLRQAVRARDGDVCRYCLATVVRAGTGARTTFGATFDHIDPALANTIENVVVSCRGCNARKKDRTPEQAGMVLHPVGATPAVEPAPAQPPPRPRPKPKAKPARPTKTVAKRPAPTRTPPPPTPRPRAKRPARKATGPPSTAG